MIVVKILLYIRHVFGFNIQPVRTMTVATNELLWYYQDCFDTNMFWEIWLSNRKTKTKYYQCYLTSFRTLQLPNFWYKLLMLTKIIKQNDIVKEVVEDFYEFHFSLLFYLKFLFTWHLSIAFEKVNWQNCFKFLVLARGHSFL